jgi:hypothetical protein
VQGCVKHLVHGATARQHFASSPPLNSVQRGNGGRCGVNAFEMLWLYRLVAALRSWGRSSTPPTCHGRPSRLR